METKDDHQFIVRTNEQYAAWCKTYYRPEALNERGMVSLHGLWAWQEQERRHAKEIEKIGNLRSVKAHCEQPILTAIAALHADDEQPATLPALAGQCGNCGRPVYMGHAFFHGRCVYCAADSCVLSAYFGQ